MSLIVLLLVSFVLVLCSCILMWVDTKLIRKAKRTREERFKIHPVWKGVGLVLFIGGVILCCISITKIQSFNAESTTGVERELSKIELNVKEVQINRPGITLLTYLKDDMAGFISSCNKEDGKYIELMYIDKIKNRATVQVSKIKEVRYSEAIAEDNVKIVKYLTQGKDGAFVLPQINYYIQLNPKWR